ncbi:hypothetical protein BBR01nite_36570 [Brevibacillus brevis]|uniref:hypothetical protein n=1 Tax=Brevibacillus brevis TaxID=1393 RepID=UPI001144ABEF|nr:hypothetical protein [Brevibacillus brevis]GEC91326.1 hypothetical protein BBR01nite_36570 [Brevibacillus brevis]
MWKDSSSYVFLLKNNSMHDPNVHAKQLGVSWGETAANVIRIPVNIDEIESDAAVMSEEIDS